MSMRASILSRRILTLFSPLAAFAAPVVTTAAAPVNEIYGELPLHFEANRGQTHEDVRFLARGPGYGLYLTDTEAVLVLAGPKSDEARATRSAPPEVKSLVVRMGLVDAASAPLVRGLNELPGKVNYYVGRDPARWRTNVPTYAKVHYRDVYPGIDLIYYGNQRQLEYDFVVAPGADSRSIVLGFDGVEELEIDAHGDLVLHAAGAVIRQQKPVIYQTIDGARREVDGGYVRRGAKRVGFAVGAHDASRPLIIDPVVLAYSSYLGGSGSDIGSAIAVDADGNAYVAGGTTSSDFPTTAEAFQPMPGGGPCSGFGPHCDAFVTKVNPLGSAIVYSTYLGGSDTDSGNGIALDAAGNAYVTGTTFSPDFPTTAGAFQTLGGGYQDAFVTKLDPTGSALVYSTRLGGGGEDFAGGIAVDGADGGGQVLVTGGTRSTNFPTSAVALQPVIAGYNDAFVTKLDPSGSALVYSTYLGGPESSLWPWAEYGTGIAVDPLGNAYVVGETTSPAFPTTPTSFQPTYGGAVLGARDAFVTKLDPTGSALVYSTYLGGGDDDEARGIAADSEGNAYVTGWTLSVATPSSPRGFPTTPGAFQTTFGGRDHFSGWGDAFLTKLDPSGSALVYSTYLGGRWGDVGEGIAVDGLGNAHVTGFTFSCDFPMTTQPVPPPPLTGAAQARGGFVAKFKPTASALNYAIWLGDEDATAIALDGAGNAYVTGYTGTLPVSPRAFQPISGGQLDAFVAKIVDLALLPVSVPVPARACQP